MACGATLKRRLEFDPLHSSPKRMCMMQSMLSPTSQSRQRPPNNTAFSEAAQKFVNDQIAARLSPANIGNFSLQTARCSMQAEFAYSLPTSVSPYPSAMPQSALQQSADHRVSESPSTTPTSSKKDVPLFTLKQVNLICKKMVHEHEERIREKFDLVLNTKLAEQYESFLKFNHDQLRLRFNDSDASYVS